MDRTIQENSGINSNNIVDFVDKYYPTLVAFDKGSPDKLMGEASENVQIVSQLIDAKFPDYQAILPKGHKTRAVLDAGNLLNACKQASIIAREGSNVVRFHFQPGADQTGKVKLLAESDETGASEIELDATVEGQELEIAFNVKFLQDGLEAITTKKVTIQTNAHNTPAVLHSTGDEENLYVLMPMHIDGN